MKIVQRFAFALVLMGLIATGCKTMTRSQKGAVIGAATGGAIGGIVGKAAGNTAMGVIIGATVGGAAGAIIGQKMDKQAEEMAKVLGDAEVKREGEGIVINFKEKVLFAFDSYALGSSAQGNLDKLTNILNKYPETNITVIGHTDSKGTTSYNQDLSENRAKSVVSYLKQKGISSTRLTAIGKGETDPVATNDTEDGRALNRRVEFVIVANEKMKADAKQEAGQ
jgi:outer membrane protein OmpA-like peptidoglycan-associated protein